MVALLVQNMERLDETVKEESDGVHNTLGTSRIVSYRPVSSPLTLAWYSSSFHS